MNIADPFKQLVERKLWPIALLLVAALVAVPFLLSKPAEDTPLPSSTVAAVPGAGGTESVVSLGDPSSREEVRAVLGARKDPFRPAQLHRVETQDDQLTDAGTPTSLGGGDTGAGSSDTGGGVDAPVSVPGADPDPTAEPAPTPEPEPEPTYDLFSLKVRFGLVGGDLSTREVKRLTGLPGGTNPAALYLGLTESRKAAVFLIDAGTEVVGDGECQPSPENCQTLVLEPGETAFLTREDKQWQLDLIEVHVRQTTDAAEARKSRIAVADGGRRALKRFNGSGGYRYSKASGTVRRISRPTRGLKAAKSASRSSSGSKLISTG